MRSYSLVVVALLLVACASSSEPTLTVDSFCQSKAQAECQIASRCGNQVARCVDARRTKCLSAQASQTTGTRVFRPANTQACVDKTNTVYAKSAITPADMTELDQVCGRVVQGTVASLSGCTTDFDCVGALICDKSLCAPKVVKKLTELCGNPGELCDVGAYCAAVGGSRQCLAKKNSGEACDASQLCVETQRCAITCQPRLPSGGPCASNDDCAPTAPYCDPYLSNKCDAGLAFAPGAAACKDYGG